MDLHQNARLTFYSREALAKKVMVEKVTLNAAAAAFSVSARTARKWVRRYREHGRDGLRDHSSRPSRSPRRTRPAVADQVLMLRRQRWTGVRIAQHLGLSRATVSRILRRHKLSRMRDLQPAPPVVRYEHPHPGDLLHLDTKKLARIVKPGHGITGDPRDETRGAGWEILHVAIDDHSRISFTHMHPTSAPNPPLPSSTPPLLTTAASASPSAACSPTTLPATTPACSHAPAANSASATCAPDPIRPAPTEKPNASSRPPCANGLMLAFTRTPPSAPPSSTSGLTSTTGTDRMLVWASRHPSLAPV